MIFFKELRLKIYTFNCVFEIIKRKVKKFEKVEVEDDKVETNESALICKDLTKRH